MTGLSGKLSLSRQSHLRVKSADPAAFAASRRRKHFLSSAARRNGNTMRRSTGTLMTMAI